jgi:hypothetical protein
MENDLTNKDAVVALMLSSTSESNWDDNCDKVKAANGGDYPSFWYQAIIFSGVLGQSRSQWAG